MVRMPISIVLLIVLLYPFAANSQTYITWQGLEPDKLASLWLIKRFIDQEAEFKLISKGSEIRGGIPFDVPSSRFKRTHTQSTFESILQDMELHDGKLISIGGIIHDIEINTWQTKKIEKTYTVQDDLRKIVDKEKNEQEAILQAILYFDELYKNTTD